ncbi:MAG: PIN domain-containing protein [Gemmatimonadetes bacterium]|nr:PIN domain-containing protein [Gemmatimonadota bacterium]MBT7912565.1 PIN domain-containing protein [Candidatus Bathyarchaeota archaeon]
MITALDTNILLDLLIPNPRFLDASRGALERAHAQGPLILCETVYAELASQFTTREEVESFLRDTNIQLVAATPKALYSASRAWNDFNARRKKEWICPSCGHRQQPANCSQCSHPLGTRTHIISDFLIGAHARAMADRLLTRDRGFYATYFTDLSILTPALP